MGTDGHTAWYHGPLGGALVAVWALLLALVAVPCAAMADAEAACGHCAVDTSPAAACFQCDTDAMNGPPPADDRGPAVPVATVPAAPVVVADRPAQAGVSPAIPRPPDIRLYLKTRRLRL